MASSASVDTRAQHANVCHHGRDSVQARQRHAGRAERREAGPGRSGRDGRQRLAGSYVAQGACCLQQGWPQASVRWPARRAWKATAARATWSPPIVQTSWLKPAVTRKASPREAINSVPKSDSPDQMASPAPYTQESAGNNMTTRCAPGVSVSNTVGRSDSSFTIGGPIRRTSSGFCRGAVGNRNRAGVGERRAELLFYVPADGTGKDVYGVQHAPPGPFAGASVREYRSQPLRLTWWHRPRTSSFPG